MKQLLCSLVLGGLSVQAQTITETFGSGVNQFQIEFVAIGNPGNAADTNGFPSPAGSVEYAYNIGKYEISRDIILKANNLGGLGVSLYNMASPLQWGNGNDPNKPATGMSFNQAARFVNYLNTIKGYSPAYTFDASGQLQQWQASVSGFDSNNPFRNSGAYFFIPNINEWYKAAFFNPATGNYTKYPNASDTAPIPISEGLTGAVYTTGGGVWDGGGGPADINNAGSLSAYGTMAQGGNAYEFLIDNFGATVRGGSFYGHIYQPTGSLDVFLSSEQPWGYSPVSLDFSTFDLGFRVASVPEPSVLSLLLAGGAVLMAGRRRTVS